MAKKSDMLEPLPKNKQNAASNFVHSVVRTTVVTLYEYSLLPARLAVISIPCAMNKAMYITKIIKADMEEKSLASPTQEFMKEQERSFREVAGVPPSIFIFAN